MPHLLFRRGEKIPWLKSQAGSVSIDQQKPERTRTEIFPAVAPLLKQELQGNLLETLFYSTFWGKEVRQGGEVHQLKSLRNKWKGFTLPVWILDSWVGLAVEWQPKVGSDLQVPGSWWKCLCSSLPPVGGRHLGGPLTPTEAGAGLAGPLP